MKRVLVAGATGYLGRHVLREFKQQGYWTRALVRDEKKLLHPGPFGEPAGTGFFDEVFTGKVTEPITLEGLCDNIDIVFSSVGLTRQKDGLTFRDVDYQGNINILTQALKAGVKKFIYVSVFNARLMADIAIVKAHEDFVEVLKKSGIEYAIIRPTGYFSDIGEYFRMASLGRTYLIRKGENKLNPISGNDLARVCIQAVELGEKEIPAGGPSSFSQREIAELAFSILQKKSKITTIPLGLAKAVIRLVRIFNRHTADLFDFFVTGAEHDMVAPAYGTDKLSDYFRELAMNEENQ